MEELEEGDRGTSSSSSSEEDNDLVAPSPILASSSGDDDKEGRDTEGTIKKGGGVFYESAGLVLRIGTLEEVLVYI